MGSESPGVSLETLRTCKQAVQEFDEAFQSFMKMHVESEFLKGVEPAVYRIEGVNDDEYNAAQRRVEVASGRAGRASELTNMRYAVQGFGYVDPVASWASVLSPKPPLEPVNIITACGQMLGRLDAMILEAEAKAVPSVDAEQMHPLVWGAARSMWRDGYYREAVLAAAEALVGQLKARTRRYGVADTSLWRETFSEREPVAGAPRLRWPGDPSDRTVRSMNEGLRSITAGVQLTVRNPATHSTDPLTLVEASERLAVLSLIARWVENCDLVEAPSE